MDKILERLELGLYRVIRIQRYFVRCDPEAEAAGLSYFGVHDDIKEEFVEDARYAASFEAYQRADQMNNREGPLEIDVEADIRTLLALIPTGRIHS